MSLKRLNLILGWVVFVAALLVYGITMEKSASFWDCGEFIAAADKLQIVHPPGAPLYLMLGRLFSFFLPDDQVAMGVNFLSAFSTALAAMFVFWSTTILGKRMLRFKEENHTQGEIIAILGAGLVAAFAFVFQDSQWFNAVEAEVYAVSTGLTAAVIYMALKWTEVHNQPKADRWLMGIALVIGLSLGVHLLNLLAIPFIALLYYFYKTEKTTPKGIGIAFIVGAIILLFVQYGVILELPKLASGLEVFFVNSLNLPFGSGVFFLTILVFLIPIFAVYYARTGKQLMLFVAMGIILFLALSQFFKVESFMGALVKAGLTAATAFALYYFRENRTLIYKLALGFGFIMIGYLSFLFVPIRSSVNTPIDINNPDNVFSMLSYLNREQYGDRPLLYGPTYSADVIGTSNTGKIYAKKDGRYEVVDTKIDYEFAPEDKMLFPRAWYFIEDSKIEAYNDWLGIKGNPSFYDNLKFFFTYQLDFMYWRYFMWNFAGRQNSEQSHGSADVGNWESGIPFTDVGRTIKAEVYPDTIKNNPSVNHFFFIPFVLGILGLILQWRFSKNDAIAVIALFLLTGVAIVIYLNQPPLQPRERDYAYVGSFLAFALWIGLSIPGLYRSARSMSFKDFSYILTGFSVVFLAMFIMGFGANNLLTLLPIAIVLAIMVSIIYAIAIGLLGKVDGKVSAIALTLLAAVAPALMGFVGWEDHNRNKLGLARAVGANYLTSCNDNAILFTEGDNDTYPLWYSQEVENTRPDIRIVNNSLLKADWYANQIQQHNGNQPGLELTFDPQDYEAGKREVIYAQERVASMSMQDLLRFIKSDDPRTQIQTQGGAIDFFPSRTFTLAIDKEAQIKNGLVAAKDADRIVDTMVIQLPNGKDNLIRDEFLIYDIIQKNINKRPIYFTGENLPSIIGLSPYTQREGASVRLLPILREDFGSKYYSPTDPPIDKEKTLAYFNDGMDWGDIDNGVYLEETGQRQVMRVMDYATNMVYDFAEEGEKEKAMETYGFIKNKIFASSVPKDNIYYIFKGTGLIDALLRIGENEEAYELAKQTVDSAFRQFQYINTATQPIANEQAIANEMIRAMQSIQQSAEEYENQEIQAYIENVLTPAE